MYKSIDLNVVADHIKTVYDSIRCHICDNYNGKRVRYVCGHTSCEDCVDAGGICILCLTPPEDNSAKPVVDEPLTKRTDNASQLLKSFQDCFNIDVYRRQRASELLKVEKELFPQCIQAPLRYYNKRKNSLNLSHNKENQLSPLPGQEIYAENIKMENSHNNVQQWINKYINRKPLCEINPNKQILKANNKNTNIQTKDNKLINLPKRKRTQNENIPGKSKSSTVTKHAKKRKLTENISTTKLLQSTNKYNVNDESGIVMDDEPVIVIDDSQSIKNDKDLKAWLAVQEAENKETFCSSHISSTFSEPLPNENPNGGMTKIPFYKKSSLAENCKYCKDFEKNKTTNFVHHKDVSITVDNKDFTAVIKVSHINESYLNHSKKHVEIQTDVSEISDCLKNDDSLKQVTNYSIDFEENLKLSQNIFIEKEEPLHVQKKMNHNVVIEESDSDEDIEASLSLEVTADVHRSCDQIDNKILTDVENLEEHSKRPRRAARGLTPTSTDSSDKENFNPNRMRKVNKHSKKKSKK